MGCDAGCERADAIVCKNHDRRDRDHRATSEMRSSKRAVCDALQRFVARMAERLNIVVHTYVSGNDMYL